jgi:hypothetical protein
MDLNNLEKKKPKKTFEQWEKEKGLRDVDPQDVSKAISKEYDCRES